MKKTLVVVADRTSARLYLRGESDGGLELAGELENPAGRKQNREIDTDRPGHVSSRHGGPPHPLERHEPAHERGSLDSVTKKCVRSTVHRDLSHLPAHDLHARIEELLRP